MGKPSNPQHDSSEDWPLSYDPYTDDGSPIDGPRVTGPLDTPTSVDMKEAGLNTDTRDGSVKYAPPPNRIT